MPKETIYNVEKFEEGSSTESGVELSWGREAEYVQLATVIFDRATAVPITSEVRGGWYVNLDRQSINSLIQKLRRARDQAFGKDE